MKNSSYTVKNKTISSYTTNNEAGNKSTNKLYYRHTGHPGGIKETTPEKLFEKKPAEALKYHIKTSKNLIYYHLLLIIFQNTYVLYIINY